MVPGIRCVKRSMRIESLSVNGRGKGAGKGGGILKGKGVWKSGDILTCCTSRQW